MLLPVAFLECWKKAQPALLGRRRLRPPRQEPRRLKIENCWNESLKRGTQESVSHVYGKECAKKRRVAPQKEKSCGASGSAYIYIYIPDIQTLENAPKKEVNHLILTVFSEHLTTHPMAILRDIFLKERTWKRKRKHFTSVHQKFHYIYLNILYALLYYLY